MNYEPPNCVELEKAVMASFLCDARVFADFSPCLKAEHFYNEALGKIFEYMARETCQDTHIILEVFPQHSELIMDCLENVASWKNLTQKIEIIIDRYNRRKLIEAGTIFINRALENYDDSTKEIVNTLQNEIAKLHYNRKEYKVVKIGDVMPALFDQFEAVKLGGPIGLSTGLIDVDQKVGYMQPGDLVILAARPSMGKSSLACNIVQYNAIRKKVPTLIFTLEMSSAITAGRMLFSEASESLEEALTGILPRATMENLSTHAGKFVDAPIFIDETPSISLNEVKTKSFQQKDQNNIGLIMVDHIHLMGMTEKSRSRNEEISAISSGLKNLARDLSLPVIALCQLSRACEMRSPARPQLSDLRDSGALEQDADKVLMLYREYVYTRDKAVENLCEVIVAKNRNGKTGKKTVHFNGRTMTFSNAANQGQNDE